MSRIPSRLLLGLAAAASLVLAACGGGGVGSGGTGLMGTLNLSLADAPSCGYDQVNVTIDKISVNQSATASDTDPGWVDITLDPAQRYDLLSLQNGILATLGQTPLPAGHYTQMRLVLGANTAADPMANSVVPTGGQETALTTPSAQQSGLKMNVDIDVAANQMADFVLDFNACKSVVKAGNSGKYLLKPVIAVTPHFISGVAGYVDPALAGGTTLISLQQNGAIVKATTPDATGHFVMPVAAGTYDFVVHSAGHAALVITGVPVADQTVTTLNDAGTALTLATDTDGAAAGTVTTATSPIDADITGLQTLANGDQVDIADTLADADTGAYTLALPSVPPMVSAYATTAAGLVFVPDATAANHFTITAVSGGVTKTAPADITAGTTVTNDFAF